MLNSLALTTKKKRLLKDFIFEYVRALSLITLQLPLAFSSIDLHHLIYYSIKSTSFLPAEIIHEARKDIWKIRKSIESRGYNGSTILKSCSIRLNHNLFRFVKTKKGNPCFKITYSARKYLTLPIKLDRQFQRFNSFISNGWNFDNISLLRNGNISVVLEKEFTKPEINQRFVVGVDIGSSTLAAVSVFDTKTSKVVKQLYFGRDVAVRQRKYEKRRAYLRGLADTCSQRAFKKLRLLKHKQFNFVKTRSGQIAKEIVMLAKKHGAYIAIEKLNIGAKKKQFNKKVNNKINKIPYGKLIEFLKSNSEMLEVPLVEINPYHTSKWCTHCGAINRGHYFTNYSLYVCKSCKQIVNSDRKASLAIAVKSVLERNAHNLTSLSSFQISKTQVPVNGLLSSNDVGMKVTV